MNNQPIRVVTADDHAIVRFGLASILALYPDLVLVGEAANGEEALAVCQQALPDVVLMDLMMPTMDGITATCELSLRLPGVRVIVLTCEDQTEMALTALKAGAIGYLLKNASPDDLAQAIRMARVGRPSLNPEAMRALIQAAHQARVSGDDLTERERHVLKLMVRGLNNSEIAARLNISQFTVKNHVSRILAKLGAASRTEAAAYAVENRLV